MLTDATAVGVICHRVEGEVVEGEVGKGEGKVVEGERREEKRDV